MLLECNKPKLLVINLDEISSNHDDNLSEFTNFIDCKFILSDNSRVRKLQEVIEDFNYTTVSETMSYSNCLLNIMRDEELKPCEVVYITGSSQEEYNHQGVSTLLLLDEDENLDKNNLPDHYKKSVKKLIKCLKGKRDYGFYGELHADGCSGSGNYFLSSLSNDLVPAIKTDLVVFGRYFTSMDSRAYIHPFSHLILQMKKGYQIDSLAQLFSSSVNFLHDKELLEKGTVTVVPPKANKRNTLLDVLNKSRDLGDESLKEEFKIDELLSLKEEYSPQKEAGSHTDRFSNVKNKIETIKKVSGHIIVFDDIITSGATALECARVLYEAGAEKVTVLAFGTSQNRSKAAILSHLTCEDCKEGEYKIRFNSRDFSAFYGCTNYPDCESTLSYEYVRKRYNSSRELIQNSFELDDDDFFW